MSWISICMEVLEINVHWSTYIYIHTWYTTQSMKKTLYETQIRLHFFLWNQKSTDGIQHARRCFVYPTHQQNTHTMFCHPDKKSKRQVVLVRTYDLDNNDDGLYIFISITWSCQFSLQSSLQELIAQRACLGKPWSQVSSLLPPVHALYPIKQKK